MASAMTAVKKFNSSDGRSKIGIPTAVRFTSRAEAGIETIFNRCMPVFQTPWNYRLWI